jgi:hypothetical protein
LLDDACAPYVVPRWCRFDASTRELRLVTAGGPLYRSTVTWT